MLRRHRPSVLRLILGGAAVLATLLMLLLSRGFTTQGEARPENEASVTLLDAVSARNIEDVRALIEGGADLEARDGNGRTPLLLATYKNDVEIARALIDAGADVNAKDAIQDSPYLYAAAEGRLDILRLTLPHGADLRSTNRYGGTGLIPAAHHGHPDVVRELLTTSIDIDHINNLGWTALLEAVILGNGDALHSGIVQQLVDAGANVNLADGSKVTPLGNARSRGYTAIAAILEAAGGR